MATLPSPPSGAEERQSTIVTRCSLLVGRQDIRRSQLEFSEFSQKTEPEALDSGRLSFLIHFREPHEVSHLATDS